MVANDNGGGAIAPPASKKRRIRTLSDPDDLTSFRLPSAVASPRLAPVLAQARPQLIVMKFGGSSLAGLEHLRRVGSIVRAWHQQRPIVVVSAMGKTTDHLLQAARQALENRTVDISKICETHLKVLEALGVAVPQEILKMLEELREILTGISKLRELTPRTRDLVVSFGERLSVRTFAACFNAVSQESTSGGQGGATTALLQARPLDAWEVGLRTTSGGGSSNSAYSQAEVLESSYSKIESFFMPLREEYSYLPVVTGYISKDMQDEITTLGRDGSDLTASVIGAAVAASEVQIWKDVSGILTTDPRLVPAARPIGEITFEEAAELSTFGAKVVHPAAVTPAWEAGVPMSVRNSMSPEDPGTRLVFTSDARKGPVVAISSKSDITVIVIRSLRMLYQHGFLARVFKVFDDFQASIDVIATSEVTVSLTLDTAYKGIDVQGMLDKLREVATVEVKEGMSMLTFICAKRDSPAVLYDAFGVFKEDNVPVEMVSHGASNVNVTFIIPGSCLHSCTRRLHALFFEK